jgi:hypothetical protein
LQALDENRIIQLRAPVTLERRQEKTLIVLVGRKRACDAGDVHEVLLGAAAPLWIFY